MRKGLNGEYVADLEADVQGLIGIHADLAFAFAEVDEAVGGCFDKPEQQAVGDQIDDAAVHEGVRSEPIIPAGESTGLVVVDIAMAILAAPHRLGLQHEVCEGMANE